MKTISKAGAQHIEALHERISELRKENESLRELLERIERIESKRLGDLSTDGYVLESLVLLETAEYKKRMIAEGKSHE